MKSSRAIVTTIAIVITLVVSLTPALVPQVGLAVSGPAVKALNYLGVSSPAALAGKLKFLGKAAQKKVLKSITDEFENEATSVAVRTRFHSMREQLFARINELPEEDIEEFVRQPDLVRKLLKGSPESLRTFNGVIGSGSFMGRVKYRVDPPLAAKPFKGIPESQLYTRENAFDLPRLIGAGLGRNGFYRMEDMEELIRLYRLHNFGETITVNGVLKPRGEIMFVKKLNGETIFALRSNIPRPDNPLGDSLPHAYLAGGEDVLAAGTIKVEGDLFEINRQSGHYKPGFDNLDLIKGELMGKGYEVSINPAIR